MSNPFESIATWLNSLSVTESTETLLRFLTTNSRELPLGPDDTPADSVIRILPFLEAGRREAFADGLTAALRDWRSSIQGGSEKYEESFFDLLTVVRDLQPASAIHVLCAIIGDAHHFDALPQSKQNALLSLVEDWRTPRPARFWTSLAERDPSRFGATAFWALAGSNQTQLAFGYVLGMLPDDKRTLAALRFGPRWFLSTQPDPSARATVISFLVDQLNQAKPAVAETLRKGFAAAGYPLPVPSPSLLRLELSALYTEEEMQLEPATPLGGRGRI